jgi:hypothetical protein
MAECHSERQERHTAQGVRLHVYASRQVSSPPVQLHILVDGVAASVVASSQKRSALPQSLVLKQRPVGGAAKMNDRHHV